jgi:hypothetical protein
VRDASAHRHVSAAFPVCALKHMHGWT